MISPDLLDCEATLRRAIAQRQISRAEELIGCYCEVANVRLSALPAGNPERIEILKRVLGVFEWARLMLCLARSGYANRLTLFQLAKQYRTPCAPAGRAVRVEG